MYVLKEAIFWISVCINKDFYGTLQRRFGFQAVVGLLIFPS